MRALLLAIFGLAFLLASGSARADGGPTVVTTGMYVNQIHELNLKENFFVADVYVWFRWKGDAVKPGDTFSFVDGRIESKAETETRKLDDGSTYSCYRVVVKVTKYWDVRQYPLDRYDLALTLEEDRDDVTVVRYEADTQSSALDGAVRMPGFAVKYGGTKNDVGKYRSNFGNPNPRGNESAYARIVTSVGVARESTTYFAKLFFALWVAAAIAFLCFFVKPTHVDPRFGLGVGAMFAAIASEYTVSSGLPEIGAATLADRLHVVAYAAVFVTLAQSTVSLRLFERGDEDRSKRLDRLFAYGLPALYVVANVAVIALR